MKITKRQLKRIINELHPRDVADAEYDDQLLNDLGGMYSDMHKELYRRRPKIPMFKTVEEAEAAVEELWGIYAEKNREREAQEKEQLEFMEMERRRQELMPGEYDIELPMRSGMGRRTENITRITKDRLRGIIKEEAYDCEKDYRAGGLTYQEYLDCLADAEADEDYGYGSYSPRKTSYVGADANTRQIAAVKSAMATKPNSFLDSILRQLESGRGLSGKQKSIVQKIVGKNDPTSTTLFEDSKMNITKKRLGKIIREEILREQSFESLTSDGSTVTGILQADTIIGVSGNYFRLSDLVELGKDAGVAMRRVPEWKGRKTGQFLEPAGAPLESNPDYKEV